MEEKLNKHIKKIFLATPITPLLDKDNMMKIKAKSTIQAILKDLRSEYSSEVFCAIEREEWGENLMDGKTCTSLDLAGLRESDIVIAFTNNSFGVHLELGWASALKKPIILLVNSKIGIKTPLVQGLDTITFVKIIYYNSNQSLPSNLQWCLHIKHDLLNAINKWAIEINDHTNLFECHNVSSNKLTIGENNNCPYQENQKVEPKLIRGEL